MDQFEKSIVISRQFCQILFLMQGVPEKGKLSGAHCGTILFPQTDLQKHKDHEDHSVCPLDGFIFLGHPVCLVFIKKL